MRRPRQPDDAALALGIQARELRCKMHVSATDIAVAHGWKPHRWLDAEQGLLGLENARRVLEITRRVAASRGVPWT